MYVEELNVLFSNCCRMVDHPPALGLKTKRNLNKNYTTPPGLQAHTILRRAFGATPQRVSTAATPQRKAGMRQRGVYVLVCIAYAFALGLPGLTWAFGVFTLLDLGSGGVDLGPPGFDLKPRGFD